MVSLATSKRILGRLVRLIPDDPDNDESEKAAIKLFFNHRLPKERTEARQEWLQIVEAEHALWLNISTAKRELIRSILNHVAFEVIKRRRPSSSFDFSEASIGNLFLTGYVFFVLHQLQECLCFLHTPSTLSYVIIPHILLML